MNDTVVKVENVSKKFCRNLKRSMYYGALDVARSMMGVESRTDTLRKGEFWSVDNVSFELRRGETLGIIGINGSGKTTLLRMLNGIFQPDNGRIEINGRIGALIAVGAGFHPLLTGRENVYLNGAILGMGRREIDKKFDEIVEFAEIGEAIDSPVKHYSSGMYVRLGFSVAIHINPEVLLIDEVLSVGDLSFQNKSLRRLAEMREKASAVIFVSHNLEHIRNICDRVVILNRGKIIFNGNAAEGIIKYQELTRDIRILSLNREPKHKIEGSMASDKVLFLNSGIINLNGEIVEAIDTNESFSHFVDFELLEEQEELIFSSGILDEKKNVVIWVISNDNHQCKFNNLRKGKYRIRIYYKNHHLMPGVYALSNGIRNPCTYETFQRIIHAGVFKVTSDKLVERGVINTNYEWRLE